MVILREIIWCNCPSEFIIENIASYYMCMYNKCQDILLNAAIFHTKKDLYILIINLSVRISNLEVLALFRQPLSKKNITIQLL